MIQEEEFGVDDSYSEQSAQYSQTHLEMMENELAGKQHEIEELNRELEEMRAAYGTEGLQQVLSMAFGLLLTKGKMGNLNDSIYICFKRWGF